MTATGISRVVALGASNLTRGFETVVSAARANWGSDVQVLAALGHGRSYGASSRMLVRRLPSILESGLWRALESLPPAGTRALVTDVGNDILYGYSVEQILAWVEEAVIRLQRVSTDITLTDLPLSSLRQLSRARFLVFRSIWFPSCRLSLAQALDAAEALNAGLTNLSASRGLRFVQQSSSWYRLDPIHIHPPLWRAAWQEILGAGVPAGAHGGSRLEGVRLYLLRPERRWLLGIEQHTPQAGVRLSRGGTVWLY